MSSPLIDRINAILPQTQCGLCGYPGCKPYAEAISKGASINLCPPGGIAGLQQLGQLTNTELTPELQSELQARIKTPVIALIREADCIGCTKCIQACPVDAIVGAAKQLHFILTDDCTGCELCLVPCPVDCIELIPVTHLTYLKSRAQSLYEAKVLRGNFKRSDHLTTAKATDTPITSIALTDKKRLIADAVARAKAKKKLTTS